MIHGLLGSFVPGSLLDWFGNEAAAAEASQVRLGLRILSLPLFLSLSLSPLHS